MLSINEQTLLNKLKKGDQAIFSFIFETHYKYLVAVANNYVNEIEAAEEIVQEVFVNLWESRKSLNITGSVKNYLIKSVKNKCIDKIRHLNVIKKHHKVILNSLDILDYTPEQIFLGEEIKEKLEKYLEQLSPDVSQTFMMSRFQKMKYQEIATKLNVSVRTVEDRVSKALKHLRKSLKEFLPLF